MPRHHPLGSRVRNRSGLRNRSRSGGSPYAAKAKRMTADRYGEYNLGRQIRAEIINGRTIHA
jgi:hypothetical protein